MWITQAALTRSDRTRCSALLSRFSVWQTRCLKSADFPYFSNSYTFVIFTLLNFLCIWVSIFHVLCCSSSLLSAHAPRLPAQVWQGDEVELGWDLSVRTCALVRLKSQMLLWEPCRKELSRLKRWVWPLPLPDPFLDLMLPAVPWRGPCLPGTAGCGSSQNEVPVAPEGGQWRQLEIQPSATLGCSPRALLWMSSSV